MKLIDVLSEDVVNYKKTSMTLVFPYCDFKCNKDAGKIVCHNFELGKSKIQEVSPQTIIDLFYINNPLTHAVVMQGLEPLHPDSINDVIEFIHILRDIYNCQDDIVIYTGYTEEECREMDTLRLLLPYMNIIIKFGRYIPGQEKHYDDFLGIYLASDNQYAKTLDDFFNKK